MSYETPILTAGGASNQTIREAVTTPRHDVGTRAQTSDGRVFYYSRTSDSSVLAAGEMFVTAPAWYFSATITLWSRHFAERKAEAAPKWLPPPSRGAPSPLPRGGPWSLPPPPLLPGDAGGRGG